MTPKRRYQGQPLRRPPGSRAATGGRGRQGIAHPSHLAGRSTAGQCARPTRLDEEPASMCPVQIPHRGRHRDEVAGALMVAQHDGCPGPGGLTDRRDAPRRLRLRATVRQPDRHRSRVGARSRERRGVAAKTRGRVRTGGRRPRLNPMPARRTIRPRRPPAVKVQTADHRTRLAATTGMNAGETLSVIGHQHVEVPVPW